MKIQHTFGIWPLELLTIQRLSYTVDKIPSHRMIVSDCNIESWWQKHYSYAFLLLTPSSSIPYYQVFVFWFLLRWPSLTFFLFLHFAITGHKPESDPCMYILKLAWKFIHSADKNCCSEGEDGLFLQRSEIVGSCRFLEAVSCWVAWLWEGRLHPPVQGW